MKTLAFILLVATVVISLPVQADFGYTCNLFETFKEASAKYGKRGRALDAIVSNTLSTKNNVWVRKNYSSELETETMIDYTPENADIKYPERKFTLFEFNFKKYQNYNLMNFVNYVKNGLKDFDTYSRVSNNRNGDLIKHTIEYKINIISETENDICFEEIIFGVSQKCLETKATLDFLGNVKQSELILQGDPKIDEVPERYTVYWAVNLGNGKYRQYSYCMREKIATEEEKTFLVDLFKKMEEQIKKIPS